MYGYGRTYALIFNLISGLYIINTDAAFFTYRCQGSSLFISCTDGKVIKVEDANFGRTASAVCGSDPMIDCVSSTAFGTMQRYCDGKTQCFVMADTSIFDDPCPDVAKYLAVYFSCVKAPTTTNSVNINSDSTNLLDNTMSSNANTSSLDAGVVNTLSTSGEKSTSSVPTASTPVATTISVSPKATYPQKPSTYVTSTTLGLLTAIPTVSSAILGPDPTTKTISPEPVTTTPIPTSKIPCECPTCPRTTLLTYEELKANPEKVKELTANITKELTLDKTKLSSTKRRLTSAPDNRTSASFVGYLGIALMTGIFSVFLFSDVISIFIPKHRRSKRVI